MVHEEEFCSDTVSDERIVQGSVRHATSDELSARKKIADHTLFNALGDLRPQSMFFRLFLS